MLGSTALLPHVVQAVTDLIDGLSNPKVEFSNRKPFCDGPTVADSANAGIVFLPFRVKLYRTLDFWVLAGPQLSK